MHAAAVTGVAVAVLLAAFYGLVEIEDRAGPIDTSLQPAVVDGSVTGTYQARADGSVGGFCPVGSCEPRTTIDVRFTGLPQVPYTALLEGADRVDLGPLVPDGDGHVLQWSRAEDHTDKDRIVLVLAGRHAASFLVDASSDPQPVEADLAVRWAVASAPLHAAEIGGVSISTIAQATVPEVPPPGWHFRAYLEGEEGRTDLGPLEGEEGTVLDGRVERLRLEDQHRVVVVLQPDDASGLDGFPAWRAVLL